MDQVLKTFDDFQDFCSVTVFFCFFFSVNNEPFVCSTRERLHETSSDDTDIDQNSIIVIVIVIIDTVSAIIINNTISAIAANNRTIEQSDR